MYVCVQPFIACCTKKVWGAGASKVTGGAFGNSSELVPMEDDELSTIRRELDSAIQAEDFEKAMVRALHAFDVRPHDV